MATKSTVSKTVVCVIGLGYVGLPLVEAFARMYQVIAFDIDENRVKKLSAKSAGNTLFTSNSSDIRQAGFIFICVPTPVTKTMEIDLSFIKNAAITVGQNMKKGSMVVLESTVYPGVTEEVVKPILENESRMVCGQDFKIGYSPERINPGDDEHTVDKMIKVVAGMDNETTEAIAGLYSQITSEVFKVKDIRTAEAAKVIENVQRDLNIALVNELAIIFEKIGLNTKDVLDAAATKWNFHRYYPGLVGGQCIPVDPYYLVHKAKEVGYNPRVILAGRKTNNYMPKYIADIMIETLNNTGKTIKDCIILIMGLTYKANVSDIRSSSTKQLVKELNKYGVQLVWYDPNVDEESFKADWEEELTIKKLNSDIKKQKFDGVILTTAHTSFRNIGLNDLKNMQNDNPILVDIPGFYNAEEASKAGIYYRTL